MDYLDSILTPSRRFLLAQKIGKLIHAWRERKFSTLENTVAAFQATGYVNYTATTLQCKLGFIEQGKLYFGNGTRAATTLRGDENLAKLAFYFRFLEIPENHEIVQLTKEYDSRFSYPLINFGN